MHIRKSFSKFSALFIILAGAWFLFNNFYIVNSSPTYSIAGSLFDTLQEEWVRNPLDVLVLNPIDSSVVALSSSTVNGSYVISGIPEGIYDILVSDTSGYLNSSSTVGFEINTNITNYDFYLSPIPYIFEAVEMTSGTSTLFVLMNPPDTVNPANGTYTLKGNFGEETVTSAIDVSLDFGFDNEGMLWMVVFENENIDVRDPDIRVDININGYAPAFDKTIRTLAQTMTLFDGDGDRCNSDEYLCANFLQLDYNTTTVAIAYFNGGYFSTTTPNETLVPGNVGIVGYELGEHITNVETTNTEWCQRISEGSDNDQGCFRIYTDIPLYDREIYFAEGIIASSSKNDPPNIAIENWGLENAKYVTVSYGDGMSWSRIRIEAVDTGIWSDADGGYGDEMKIIFSSNLDWEYLQDKTKFSISIDGVPINSNYYRVDKNKTGSSQTTLVFKDYYGLPTSSFSLDVSTMCTWDGHCHDPEPIFVTNTRYLAPDSNLHLWPSSIKTIDWIYFAEYPSGLPTEINGQDIYISFLSGSDLSSLTAHVGFSDTYAMLNPPSGSTIDLSSGPFQYTVTAEDGSSLIYNIIASFVDKQDMAFPDSMSVGLDYVGNIYINQSFLDYANDEVWFAPDGLTSIDQFVTGTNYFSQAYKDGSNFILYPPTAEGDFKFYIINSGTTLLPASIATLTTDYTRPTIVILGDNPVEVIKNSVYIDSGFEVWDEIAGVPTKLEDIKKNVYGWDMDTSEVGTFTVIYSSSDRVGNSTGEYYRTVEVVEEKGIQDDVFSESITVNEGSAVSVSSTGNINNEIWFAPSTTVFTHASQFVQSATMTMAVGDATEIIAPTQPGFYRLYVISEEGIVSAPSLAWLGVKPENNGLFSSSTIVQAVGGVVSFAPNPAIYDEYIMVGGVFAPEEYKDDLEALFKGFPDIGKGETSADRVSAVFPYTASSTTTTVPFLAGEYKFFVLLATEGGKGEGPGAVALSDPSDATLTVTGPANQNLIFTESTSTYNYVNLVLVPDPSVNEKMQFWFAPAGMVSSSDFIQDGPTTSLGMLGPMGDQINFNFNIATGTYYFYVIDEYGNVSEASTSTLTILPSANNSIRNFYFYFSTSYFTGDILGVIDETATPSPTIKVYIPNDPEIDVTHLSPSISFPKGTNSTVSPEEGVEQDFTNPVVYTVTAESGDIKQYIVTVEIEEDIENLVLPASKTVYPENRWININSSGNFDNQVWLAPAGLTSTEQFDLNGVTTTKTDNGQNTNINAPGRVGEYFVYVINNVGDIFGPSDASVTVTKTLKQNEFLPVSTSSLPGENVTITIPIEGWVGNAWFAPEGMTSVEQFVEDDYMTKGGWKEDYVIKAPNKAGNYRLYVVDDILYGNVSDPSNAILTVLGPDNQDEVFPNSTSTMRTGEKMLININPVGLLYSNVWFAPPSTTIFEKGDSMTVAYQNDDGMRGEAYAPMTTGTYHLYIEDEYNNFSDQSLATWTILSSNSTNIDNFGFTVSSTYYKCNISDANINCYLPLGTDRGSLTPNIQLSKYLLTTIYPENDGLPKDFTNPQIYTVTAEDEVTTKEYTVSVFTAEIQDVVFPVSKIISGGNWVEISSSGDADNNVWFAPDGLTTQEQFYECATMTKAYDGTYTGMNVPSDEGIYYIYIVDIVGNVSTHSIASLTVDNTPPVISLIGDVTTTIYQNSNYVDAGATAEDIIDGDITSKIVRTSKLPEGHINFVDTKATGTFYLAYYVCDTANNCAESNLREINIVEYPFADMQVLEATIATATAIYNSAVTGTLPGQYPVSSTEALLSAIQTAQSYTSTSPQVIIDQAVLDLQDAIDDFELDMVPYSDLTALNAEIDTALELFNTTVTGTNPGQYPTSAKNALLSAIETAQTYTSSTPSSTILSAIGTLQTAETTYTNSMIPYSDMTALNAEIATSTALYNSAVTGTLPGQYPLSAMTTFASAIQTAQTYNSSTPSSTVATAVTTLSNARTTFSAAQIGPDNTPPVITKVNGAMKIYTGTIYTDLGATAYDVVYGTTTVITSGTVNTSTPGIYTITYTSTDGSANTATTTRTVEVLAVESDEQVLTTSTQINITNPIVVVGDNSIATSTITVPSDVTSTAALDLSAVSNTSTTSTVGTLPGAITVNVSTTVGVVQVVFPAGTFVSGTTAWDGTIALPTLESTTTVSISATGKINTNQTVLELGFSSSSLTFDKAIKIVIPNQPSGVKVAYNNGGGSTDIAVCTAGQLSNPDTLSAGGNCYSQSGSVVTIWTKHFTYFFTYTQTNTGGGGSGGGGGGGGGGSTPPVVVAPVLTIPTVGRNPVVINGGALITKERVVSVSFNVANATEMLISEKSSFVDATWEKYAITKSFTLSSSVGRKTIYAMFRSFNGGMTNTYLSSITYSPDAVSTSTFAVGDTCSILAPGDMIKVVGKPAIYVLDNNMNYRYFSDGDVFKSWNADDSYAKYYKSIPQSCFDSLSQPTEAPYHVFYRPGSEVVKYLSSDKLYVVGLNNTLYPITLSAAKSIFGDKFKAKTIGLSEWPYYVKSSETIAQATVYPGMLAKIGGRNYFVDEDKTLREISALGMLENNIKTSYVRTLPSTIVSGFALGETIVSKILAFTSRIGF